MGTAAHCAWCGKPMLDAEHARKHVVEQCEAAPWKEAIAKMRAELVAANRAVAILVARLGGEARLTQEELVTTAGGSLITSMDKTTREIVVRYSRGLPTPATPA